MKSNRTSAKRMLAANPLIIGAAFLALVSFSARSAFAQSITIFHDNTSNLSTVSNNPFDTFHTVVGQISGVSGHCAERVCSGDGSTECTSDADCTGNGTCSASIDPDIDGDAGSCTSDSECDGGGDDFCSFSGYAVGITVTAGPNVGAGNTTYALTNAVGQVSLNYQDLGGVGTDTIQGCLDTAQPPDEPGDDPLVTDCIAEGPGEDVQSNILTKNWLPTVVLSPPGAFNLVGGSHTVTATLNGVAGFCNGGVPSICTSDLACLGDGVCDFSGYSMGIKVTSGPNTGPGADTGLVTTNSKGQVTMTYSDTLAGTDTIQACADLFNDGDADVGACLADAAAGGGDGPFDDIASNVGQKTWSAVNVALTPLLAFNPIGVDHVVTATGAGISKRCAAAQGFGTCTTDADCSGVVGSCTLAGYPVFFAVTGNCVGGNNGGAICTNNLQCDSLNCSGGPNLGQETTGVTNASGAATGIFTSAVEGQDRIQACLDGDPAGFGIDDETGGGFIMCINDFNEGDIPSNTVIKNWFANFVTGGGGVNVGSGLKKKNLQNSGIVGKAGLAGIQGDWQAVSQIAGKTVACHFNTFTSIAFSGGPATSPPSTHSVATFTTGPGKCNDGSNTSLTVTITDLGEGKKVPRDTISVTSNNPSFATGGTLPLVTGNYQVHSITP